MIRSFYTLYIVDVFLKEIDLHGLWQNSKCIGLRRLLLSMLFAASLAGCSSIISSATSKMADNLSTTILNSNDPQTVADGAPAYLLLVSSFLKDGADNENLLRSAATLHSAYAGVFIKDKDRAAKMATQALDYALRTVCVSDESFCNLRKMPFKDFSDLLKTLDKDQVKNWYALGTTWTGWIQLNSKDWNAVAELARVKIIFARLLELSPDYKQGGVHLYMAALSTLLPPALGGKPEIGKQHFEKAITLSKGKNLMAKVLYAEKYAKLLFNKELHDSLLKQVLAADPMAPDLTLMNTLAQQKAKELLVAGEDYF